ncbi:MAG: butyrate kinase [Lachnospiraceae bacterium]|nr:butyrate kinase [Lachnospiraceae bacterium]
MAEHRLLIINPGSTSTKISVFDDRECVFTESIFHDAPVLLSFPAVNDQVPFRKQVILELLKKHDIDIHSVDVFVGRGGSAYTQKAGVMPIDERLYNDTANAVGGSDHPAKLGVMLAYELCSEYGGQMFTLDPTNVDELCDYARYTGIKGIYRKAQTHVLNQKGIGMKYARSLGRQYEDCNFIICHIDGGITITAHQHGKMVDSNEGSGGDGPFTPTRLGSIPVLGVLEYLDQGHTVDEMRIMCSRAGGFVNHFGTSDADRVHKLVEAGDAYAKVIWNTMIYQICKYIGEMAVVMDGKVDSIILTGGLVRFDDIIDMIRQKCGWIADVTVFPGEVEQEALAHAVCGVLEGKKQSHEYTGIKVWTDPFNV